MTKHFVLHDLSRFPIVTFQPELAQGGYASVWANELETLMDRGEAFVIVAPVSSRPESKADWRDRDAWLKNNRQRLSAYCRGLISIEPDTVRRAELRSLVVDLESEYGVFQHVVASDAIAQHVASQLLTGRRVLEAS
jgi:hypothetical protein